MKEDTLKIIEELRNKIDDSMLDEEYSKKASVKLNGILSEHGAQSGVETHGKTIAAIEDFMNGSEVCKNKVMSYCLDFYDPTEKRNLTVDGQEVQLHTFLKENELLKLYKFVLKHSEDSTFGESVYKLIKSHGMTSPQVYKNAMMRRQDFSRVTGPKCKSVTRQIAWQIIIGLHCNSDEADEVLFSAGFIRNNSRFDLTMYYFIEQKNYDIMAINEVLYELDLKVFSCHKPVRDKDTQ